MDLHVGLRLQGRNVVNGETGWFPCAAVRPFICVSTETPKAPPNTLQRLQEPQGLGTVGLPPKSWMFLGV